METKDVLLEEEIDLTDVSRINHAEVLSLLAMVFNTYLVGKHFPPAYVDLNVVLPLSGVNIGPDLCVIRRFFSPDEKIEGFEGVPEVVVEVVSPSSFFADNVKKLHLYASEGVPEYWIVTPESRSIVVYQLKDRQYEIFANAIRTGFIHSAVLPDFSLDLKSVFLDYT